MGNNNSASFNTSHPPPPWTQSLPRDAHRRRKQAAGPPGTKVLPERIPGQRLRPTENGRNLQVQGTISHRKLAESISMPNGHIQTIHSPHSTSMTALNGNGHMHQPNVQPKLGYTKMSFTSEPDLREVPQSLPPYPSPHPPQTMITESPTKGRIVSKKRHKAPPPPLYEGNDYSAERNYSSPSPLPREDWSVTDSPKHDAKSKPKKIGLFKKKSDVRARKSVDEVSFEDRPIRIDRVRIPPIERVILPTDEGSPKAKELRHRARSLDNLQHEVQRERTTSDSQLDVEGYIKAQIPETTRENHIIDKSERKSVSPLPSFEYGLSPVEKQMEYRAKMADAENEWDKAEQEYVEKKKRSENLQKEIINAALNLRKINASPEIPPHKANKDFSSEKEILESQEQHSGKDSQPKTFFFGMEPASSNTETKPYTEDCIEEVRVLNHRTQSPLTEKIPRDKKSRSRDANTQRTKSSHVNEHDQKDITQRMDEFVVTIERSKRKLKPNADEYTNSLSRRGDGGYHSRQNSGSLPQDTENSGEEDSITMNLRPMIPRRQLDLPRFSPNAAWRSLGTETSSRSKESYIDSTITEEIMSLEEEKIRRSTRQTAPSRGSGEKSADSGISGDAGSPGLTHEFEPISPKKSNHVVNSLSVSSPLEPSRSEKKRAWTPAQDLDDNSLDESADIRGSSPFPQEPSTFPRLTSRTNMFNEEDRQHFAEKQKILCNSAKDIRQPTDKLHRNNFNVEINSSYQAGNIDQSVNADSWRENWSLSRSIPNSINICDDVDKTSSRGRSESRMSGRTPQDTRSSSAAARPTTPSYMKHGNSGHIMYLPEYKAYQVKQNSSDVNEYHSESQSKSEGFERSRAKENCRPKRYDPADFEGPVPGYPLKNPNTLGPNDKKKKFAYKSTIRIVEKKKLEEKLSKEAQEMEERRLKEIDAMKKVEEEFQLKREREKRRLKKQLHLYQKDHVNRKSSEEYYSSDNSPQSHDYNNGAYIPYNGRPTSPASPRVFYKNDRPPYKSLPPEYSDHHQPIVQSESNGIFSGIKKWVRGKKDSKLSGGYSSDASSTTITSISRQEPDGAPASHKRANGNFREEIIASARTRNGLPNHESSSHSPSLDYGHGQSSKTLSETSSEVRSNRSFEVSERSSDVRSRRSEASGRSRLSQRDLHRMNPHYLPHRKSPAASESSRKSPRRSYTPDSRRTLSPDSHKSHTSDMLPLTQELPESRQEVRQYKEFRQSSRKHQPVISPIRVRHPDPYNGDNYRRNFVLGQMHNYPVRGYPGDIDQHSKNSNDSRRSKRSLVEYKRSREPVDYETRSLQRRPSSQQKYLPVPIDSSPARFAQNMLTPFHPSKAYRPVIFSASPHVNIVGVQ